MKLAKKQKQKKKKTGMVKGEIKKTKKKEKKTLLQWILFCGCG